MPDYSKMVKGALAAAGGIGAATMTPDEAEAIFGGRLSKTANLKALSEAMKLRQQGARPEQVWKDTGWFRDPAGMDWKYEIPDQASAFRYVKRDYDRLRPIEQVLAEQQQPRMTVGMRFKHPELFQAYPELADVPLYTFPSHLLPGTRAAVSTGGTNNMKRIGLSSIMSGPDARSALLHELQHMVQGIEGFPPGGSMRDPNVIMNAAKQVNLPIPASGPNLQAMFDDLNKTLAGRQALREQYQALAGEVEARNVQQRLGFYPGQLKAMPPWYSTDVAASNTTILPARERQFQFPFEPGKQMKNPLPPPYPVPPEPSPYRRFDPRQPSFGPEFE